MKKYFYPLIDNPFRTKDVNQAIKVLRSSKITSGPKTLEFQNKFSKKIKTNYSLLVNSGSSANLLAMQCLPLYNDFKSLSFIPVACCVYKTWI